MEIPKTRCEILSRLILLAADLEILFAFSVELTTYFLNYIFSCFHHAICEHMATNFFSWLLKVTRFIYKFLSWSTSGFV